MKKSIIMLSMILLSLVVFNTQKSYAHCDTKTGPVVTAAKNALNTGNVNLVLIWIQKEDEGLIKSAFANALEVRKLNTAAQELADNYFFETLVRIHRQGEGAPYTGIKEDSEVELPVKAADEALDNGSAMEVQRLLADVVTKGVNDKFNTMLSSKRYDKNDVEAGRKLVENYVKFMHYVEGIYNAASKENHNHVETLEKGRCNHQE